MELAMHNEKIWDLAECTEFRQTLQASPPSIVHGTVMLLATLLGAVLVWSALTQADLVVRAPGRVRPVTSPLKVVNDSSGAALSASFGGRVLEVNFHQGKGVRQGEVLIRLDTERLDNEISKRKRSILAGEEELQRLGHLGELSAWQYATVKAKAEAELAQAREEIVQAKNRQATDVRLAELELEDAGQEETQLRKLVEHEFAPRNDLRKATARVRETEEKLKKTQLPIDDRKIEIFRQALALAEKDYAVKRKEQEMQRGLKQGEIEAARIELANLELERKQGVIRAPMDGIVTTGDVKVGDFLERGKSVVEIAEQKGFRFEAAVPSEEVGNLRVGMKARIKLDAYDYQRYGTVAGTVIFISPDSGVPEGQRATLYLVRIELEQKDLGRGKLRGQVKLGMAGHAEIVSGQESLLALLVKQIRQTISLG
jgi:multidrug resistance efflux pump